jgi:hypothetical protein
MPTYQTIVITSEEITPIEGSVAWNDDIQMWEQFRWCAQGGEDGLTECVVLYSEEGNSYVGFCGLTLKPEDLKSVFYAYIAVEFVYLHEDVRQRHLSRHFIDFIIARVRGWLDELAKALLERNVVLYSASNLKSDDGERFIRRLEEQLSAEASSRGFSFNSCIDGEG